MANPIFESRRYRRDLPEARVLEEQLRMRFYVSEEVDRVVNGAGIDRSEVITTGATAAIWASILDHAAKSLELESLLTSVGKNLEPLPKDADIRATIESVRNVTEVGGSLSPARLLLSGDRPFLARATLRGYIGELRNWNSPASILVVRGDPDSGRSETQILLNEGRDITSEKMVLVHELLPLDSTLRAIWKAAGALGNAPAAGQEPLTTESAMLMDFWTDVKEALEANDRLLWILFDDLDKGPGRVAVRTLAEVLAIRLTDVGFQQRIRLVLLGYPDPQLPSKVKNGLVRNDTTDKVEELDVMSFVDYCAKARGKTVSDVSAAAANICAKATANISDTVPYLEALNFELRAWYRGLQ